MDRQKRHDVWLYLAFSEDNCFDAGERVFQHRNCERSRGITSSTRVRREGTTRRLGVASVRIDKFQTQRTGREIEQAQGKGGREGVSSDHDISCVIKGPAQVREAEHGRDMKVIFASSNPEVGLTGSRAVQCSREKRDTTIVDSGQETKEGAQHRACLPPESEVWKVRSVWSGTILDEVSTASYQPSTTSQHVQLITPITV